MCNEVHDQMPPRKYDQILSGQKIKIIVPISVKLIMNSIEIEAVIDQTTGEVLKVIYPANYQGNKLHIPTKIALNKIKTMIDGNILDLDFVERDENISFEPLENPHTHTDIDGPDQAFLMEKKKKASQGGRKPRK